MPDIEKDKKIRKGKKIHSIKFYILQFINYLNQLDFQMAIKITFTAILSLYLCQKLDSYLTHPEYVSAGLWGVVAAIVVLQTNIGGTYKAVWNRFLGVFIGSAIGVFFAFEFGAETWVIGLAIFTTIVLCSQLNIQESYRMACLSVVIIMIPWQLHPTSAPWIFAFFRFLDTCLGFIIAILVSHILWPSQALTKMRLNMAEIFNLSRQFFEHLLIPATSLHKSKRILESLQLEIDQAFLQSRLVLEESKVELLLRFAPVGVWVDLINSLERLWESLCTLRNVFDATLDEVFDESLRQQFKHTVEVIDFVLKELSLKLKTGQTNFDFNLLCSLHDSLNQEMTRFRSTHAIKKYNLDIVEDYFVSFYQLKQILQTLYQFNQLLNQLSLRKIVGGLEE